MHKFVTNLTRAYVKFICVVICEPPCEQGACVANDTCNCAEGYIGERCTEPGQYNFVTAVLWIHV